MTKYLSYEKSKRLAELGYEPEDEDNGWWCLYIASYFHTPAGTVEYYRRPSCIDKDDDCREWTPAPDCDDLLRELQKFGFRLSGMETEFHIVTRLDGVDPGYLLATDTELIECAGQALINKLLEEKQ